ncbi:MAG: hypothetical protein ACRDE8_07270, partial [Ginsengibacter sp.]
MLKIILNILCGYILIIFISCNGDSKNNVQPSIPKNSKASLKNAIRLYPDSLTLVQNLIEVYRNEGSYYSALALTNDQIKKDSNNAY